jgi:flagellar basal-body rod modification protein FlgD
MIPPTLALSAATSAYGMLSSIASAATSGTSSGSPTTNGTTPTSGTGSTSSTGSSTDPTAGGDASIVNTGDFMKLLIAQLQNQDPMDPLDSANFASQLAQFSSLEQLTQINTTLTNQSQNKIGSFDAVSFIGRQVTGASGAISEKSGTATTLDYTLTQAGTVDATITDKNGQVVGALKLDGLGVGAHTFDLSQVTNAPHLDDGTYTVALSQADATSGTPTTIATTVTGRVTGVDLTGASPVLLLGDRTLNATNVTEIQEIAAGSGA